MLAEPLKFERFELDSVRRVLRRDGDLVALRPKAFTLLSILVENRHRIVGKEELLGRLWPDGFGTEANLTVNIAAIRRALGEEPREHRYVVTVPTVGYRFVAPIDELQPAPAERPPALPDGARLAVLPFAVTGCEKIHQDLDVSPAELLSFGLADSLITCLSAMPRITLRSSADVQSYVGRPDLPPASELAEQLHADAIMMGTVRADRESCSIELQVTRAEDGARIWSTQLSHPSRELQALPVRISRVVVAALRGQADRARVTAFDRRYTERDDAFQLYLQGRYHFWNGQSPQGLQRAIECFRRAIELDPSYALAHSGLAETYLHLWSLGLHAPAELMERAREAAKQALELDPILSDAHRAMGMVAMLLDWNWPAAREHFLSAIEYQPTNALAYDRYAFYLAARRKFDEAIAMVRRAQELDPLSMKIHADVATILHFAGRTTEAKEMLEHAVDRDPQFFLGHVLRGWMRLATGESEEAIVHFEHLATIVGDNAWTDSLLGTAYAAAERVEDARSCLRRMQARARVEFVQPSFFALVHTYLGEMDEALDQLQRAADSRYGYLAYIDADPLWRPLWEQPAFESVRRRILGPKD